MKILIIIFLNLAFLIPLFAQQKDPISINVEIIAKGNAEFSSTCDNCFFTRFEVHNNRDTTLPITIWGCSWDWNWKSNCDSIWIVGWGCDGNGPEIMQVPSNESLVFYGGIRFKSPKINTVFKLAFANCNRDFINLSYAPVTGKPQGKFYWSSPIKFKGSQAYPNMNDYLPDYFITNLKTGLQLTSHYQNAGGRK